MDKNNKIDYVRMTAGNNRILDVLKFAKDQEIKWQELEKQRRFAEMKKDFIDQLAIWTDK